MLYINFYVICHSITKNPRLLTFGSGFGMLYNLQLESFFTVEIFISDEPAEILLTDTGLVEMGEDRVQTRLCGICFPTSGTDRKFFFLDGGDCVSMKANGCFVVVMGNGSIFASEVLSVVDGFDHVLFYSSHFDSPLFVLFL
jgi:hypothetical protein